MTQIDYRRTPIPKWVRDALDESLGIEAEDARAAGTLGYMTRALVNATLPYKNPKSPLFERKNGQYTLRMVSGSENGLPYGIYPRIIMSWITTEAVRTKSPELELGESLSAFLKGIGIQRGGGKLGPNARFSDQMERLFSTLITAFYSGKGKAFQLRNITIVDDAALDEKTADMLDEAAGDDCPSEHGDGRLWTPQKQEEAGRWKSRVVLSKRFFDELCERPVPINLQTYGALRGSPIAMDVYVWLTYRMSYLRRSIKPIPWEALLLQFGSEYKINPDDPGRAVRDFRSKSFLPALKVIAEIYPDAKFETSPKGLILHPSKPHVAFVDRQYNLFTDKP